MSGNNKVPKAVKGKKLDSVTAARLKNAISLSFKEAKRVDAENEEMPSAASLPSSNSDSNEKQPESDLEKDTLENPEDDNSNDGKCKREHSKYGNKCDKKLRHEKLTENTDESSKHKTQKDRNPTNERPKEENSIDDLSSDEKSTNKNKKNRIHLIKS